MVAGGDGDVFAASALSGSNKLICPAFFGSEALSQLLVLFGIQFQAVERPFTFAQQAVQTEMDKHTETEVFKILNSLLNDHG